MNINNPESSRSSRDPNEKPSEPIGPLEPPEVPTTTPLSSPSEPTRMYTSDPSKTYSSDPSKYSESSKVYTTESGDTTRISENAKNQGQKNSQQTRQDEKKDQTQGKWRGSKKTEELYDYASMNKHQLITYALLIFGLIILLFASNLLGGLIIGAVAGYHFSDEIVYYLRHFGQIGRAQDQLRCIVFAAILLGLFIGAPGIFIGAAIVAVFKQVIGGNKQESEK